MRAGEPEDAGGVGALYRAQRRALRRRQRRDDVVEREHRRPRESVEPGLRVRRAAIDHAERSGRRAEGQRLDAEGRHPRGIAQGEGGAEQPAVTRVLVVEGMAPVVAVDVHARPVGVVTHADGARRDPVGLAPGQGLGRRHHVRQRLERFHHRPIVRLVHNGTGAVGEEVEQARVGMVAVQLGEVREHAAAEPDARKGGAGRPIHLREAGEAERLDALQGEAQQPRLLGHDGSGPQPRPGRRLRRRLQFPVHGPRARHHDFEHDLGVERRRERSISRESLGRAGLPRVVFADEMPGAERRQQGAPVLRGGGGVGHGDAEPDLGHDHARLAADRDRDRIAAASGANRRGAPLEFEGRRLAQPFAFGQGVGIGQGQRAVIGLERSVRPVPLVLGLPRVGALEPAGETSACGDAMAHGADVEERLQRHHEARERRLLRHAGTMGDVARLARHSLDRVEGDEAAAAGLERRLRHRVDGEDEPAFVFRHDGGREGEDAVGRIDAGVVTHPEAAALLDDLQVRDGRSAGLPGRAADDEGEAAQGLDAAEADIAQLAAFQFGGEHARAQEPDLRRRLLGAVERQGVRWCRAHVPLPVRRGPSRYSSDRQRVLPAMAAGR